jgi:cytochrome bd-type quinol oxidase subunit 1
VATSAVVSSFTLFVVVYAVLLLAFFFYAWRIIVRGPQIPEAAQSPLSVRPGMDSALARIPAG